jgi:hypothetical protein
MKTEIAIVIICLLMVGCSQRICEYDPTTGIWRYKSNSLATESHADKVTITTPSGIVVTVEKATQDNDSVQAVTPSGAIKTTN